MTPVTIILFLVIQVLKPFGQLLIPKEPPDRKQIVSLNVTIISTNNDITFGEPILLSAEISNKTEKQIYIHNDLSIAYSLWKKETQECVFDSAANQKESPDRNRPRKLSLLLPAQGNHSLLIVLGEHRHKIKPGEYELRLTYYLPSRFREAEPRSIEKTSRRDTCITTVRIGKPSPLKQNRYASILSKYLLNDTRGFFTEAYLKHLFLFPEQAYPAVDRLLRNSGLNDSTRQSIFRYLSLNGAPDIRTARLMVTGLNTTRPSAFSSNLETHLDVFFSHATPEAKQYLQQYYASKGKVRSSDDGPISLDP